MQSTLFQDSDIHVLLYMYICLTGHRIVEEIIGIVFRYRLEPWFLFIHLLW